MLSRRLTDPPSADGGVGDACEVVWVEGNLAAYIEDSRRRKGTDADQPHRIACEKLVRA